MSRLVPCGAGCPIAEARHHPFLPRVARPTCRDPVVLFIPGEVPCPGLATRPDAHAATARSEAEAEENAQTLGVHYIGFARAYHLSNSTADVENSSPSSGTATSNPMPSSINSSTQDHSDSRRVRLAPRNMCK